MNRYCFAANIRTSREFAPGLGNIAWKERVDSWRQEKSTGRPSLSQAPSEGRFGGSEARFTADIDASTDVAMDDSLL